jgi:putative ATPase
MVIFAAEDIGNADPQALQVAVAAKDAVDFVGLPEGRIPLAQAVTYLASAPKSNAAYRALLAASADVKKHGTLPVPLELRNAPTPMMKSLGYGAGYFYPHDYEGEIVQQQYLPSALAGQRYYQPGDAGREAELKARLEEWAARRATEPGKKKR